MTNPKYARRVNDEERKVLDKTLDEFRAFKSAAIAKGLDPQSVKHGWFKDKDNSLFSLNPAYKTPEQINWDKLQKTLVKELQNYSPQFPKLEREKYTESHLLVVDPADIHIGKLCSAFEVGEAYDSQIAVQRALRGVSGLLQKTSSFNIDKILFVGGNDILHIDSPKRTTTSGTPQDTSGQWHDNFILAKNLYIDILEKLLLVADVHFVFNPSNHDYTHGFFLAQVIQTYFKNCKNITFDVDISHRKYFQYYSNLIGTSHGDGAKMQDLPMLMATEEPKMWSESKHRYVYVHHLHHKWSKDFMSVCVEGLRSPSGTDSWHHRNGYQHAPKAVEGFLHSKEHGQISRITHIF
jgi:hypothetical protein